MIWTKARRRQNLKRLAIGSTVAAAAGYVAGVLTAPQSGKKTRKDIKKAADKSIAETEKELKKAHTQLSGLIDKTKKAGGKTGTKARKEVDEIVKTAKKTKEKARQVLSAVHEGDANDTDLKKAVKEANDAISHLKKYLKK
jgi:gas vesicle protein